MSEVNKNAALNGITNIQTIECDVFEKLREYKAEKKKFDLPHKEETIIDDLIDLVRNCHKMLYDPNKEKKYYYEKSMQIYLFTIYIILKNYPFFINKRETLQNYFTKLIQYKK